MALDKIAVLGAGSWGTALAVVASNNARQVTLWARRPEVAARIDVTRENPSYLPGVSLPPNIKCTDSPEEAVRSANLVLFVVPSNHVSETVKLFAPHLASGIPVVNGAKGFEPGTNALLSTVFKAAFPDNPFVVISGPNIAKEIARGLPSATVAASTDADAAESLQDALMTPYFRVYTSPDVRGVELGGALKNIIALTAGISDGLELGDNVKAATMTRGLTEMVRLGVAMDAMRQTFAGLSGMGDLIVTCTSTLSRNHWCGVELAHGRPLREVLASTTMVVEGVGATAAAAELAHKYGVEMPLTEALHGVLFEGNDPRKIAGELMTRLRRSETEELAFPYV